MRKTDYETGSAVPDHPKTAQSGRPTEGLSQRHQSFRRVHTEGDGMNASTLLRAPRVTSDLMMRGISLILVCSGVASLAKAAAIEVDGADGACGVRGG